MVVISAKVVDWHLIIELSEQDATISGHILCNSHSYRLTAQTCAFHYENTPIQYTSIFHGCKNHNFQKKNCDFLLKT